MPASPHIAIAHDWLVGLRGGEWVLDRLARLFGPTELYTLVNDGRFLTDAIANCNVITSPLQRFPGAAGKLRRHYLPLMPWSVEKLKVRPCDLLISTSSAVMKSIVPPGNSPHLCYCHSPARYIWDQSDDYAHGEGGLIRRLGLRAVQKRFQDWDRRTATRVTQFLANSAHTAERIRRCYGRDSIVIHPPVRTEFFTLNAKVAREDWYLVVGALEPYKRTDIVIDAARDRFNLRIAGNGSQRGSLEQRAHRGNASGKSNAIEFLGRVADDQLRDSYRRARALIFPQVEDFGIISAEAQACGCPVVALAKGGGSEIVTAATGELFEQQNVESLLAAINRFERREIDPHACRANALRFSEARFDEQMLGVVASLLATPQEPVKSSPICAV